MSARSDADTTTVARPTTRWMVLFRRWSWLPVLLVGAVLYELVRLTLEDTGDPLFVPTQVLLGAAVVPVAFVAFVSGRCRQFELRDQVVVRVGVAGQRCTAPCRSMAAGQPPWWWRRCSARTSTPKSASGSRQTECAWLAPRAVLSHSASSRGACRR
ncbi:MAG: protease PrsW [Modestobacter sp.]|nr:protease PrsW [Modestobacter sp.]